jgi:hypothetical protein
MGGGRLGFTVLSKTTVVPDTQTTTAASNTAATTQVGGTSTAATSTSDNNTTGNNGGGTATLYVWNQNAKSLLTLEKRLAINVGVMESIIYPGHTTK